MDKRKIEYEFSAGLRITHWIRFILMIVLIVTGYYIAYVFVAPDVSNEPTLFLQAEIRFWHQVAGFALIGITIYKTYLFIFDRQSRIERVAVWNVFSPKIWIKQIMYYLYMGDHPETQGVYNPLQFFAYLLVYLMLALVILTGLVLYVNVYHADGIGAFLYPYMRPLEAMMGGLSMVRQIHHITMWVFIIFLVIHIYLATWNSIMGREGAMDSIFSGNRFIKPHKH